MDISDRYAAGTLPYLLLCFAVILHESTSLKTVLLVKRIQNQHAAPIKLNAESFHDLVFDSNTIIDRSLFIKEIMEHPQKQILVTVPPKWSKTMNVEMLKTFLNLEVDSDGNRVPFINRTSAYNLFSYGHACNGTECRSFNAPFLVSKYRNLMLQHLGQHPVVYIPFKYIKGLNDAEAIESVHSLLRHVYAPHSYLIKILHDLYRSINETDETSRNKKQKTYKYFRHFKNIVKGTENDDEVIVNSLELLCKFLYRQHRKRVIVLIDDYDLPFYKLLHERHFPESDIKYVLKHLDHILAPVLDQNNQYIERVFIFGTRCYNLFDPPIFNYTLANNPWIEYFTTTLQEQDELSYRTNKTKHQRLDAVAWFSGFRAGRDHTLNLTNQYSTLNFINTGSIRIYFTRAQGFDYMYRLVNIRPIREALESLAHKKLLAVRFTDLRFSKADMRHIKQIATAGLNQDISQATIDLTLSYLCASGYLTFHKTASTATLARVWAPNKETLGEICKKLKAFYIRNYGIQRFIVDKTVESLRDFISSDRIAPLHQALNDLFLSVETLGKNHSNFQNQRYYNEVTQAVISFLSIMWRSLTKYYTVSWKEGELGPVFVVTGKDYYDAVVVAAQFNESAEHLLDLAKQKKPQLHKYRHVVFIKYLGISLRTNRSVDVEWESEVQNNPS